MPACSLSQNGNAAPASGKPGTIIAINAAKIISMENQEQTPKKPVADNAIKNPDDWSTGDEPMTGAQRSYLHTLAGEAKEDIDDQLSKAEASKKIEDLQEKTGRGKE